VPLTVTVALIVCVRVGGIVQVAVWDAVAERVSGELSDIVGERLSVNVAVIGGVCVGGADGVGPL